MDRACCQHRLVIAGRQVQPENVGIQAILPAPKSSTALPLAEAGTAPSCPCVQMLSVDGEPACGGWASEVGVGIGGRSLGGNISYAAVLADARVRAAASVVGSPEWTLPRPHSPHHHPDRFFPAAILSQAAELDGYVLAGPIRDFHARLEPLYAQQPDRIQYVEYPGAGHLLTPELNTETCRRLVAWFQRWLPPQAVNADRVVPDQSRSG